jgi:ABC-type antimicrobial peptide transport system permease subunit
LGLASVGVYGTISYWVSERSREIGVRMALGASARSVAMMVVGRASVLTGCGIALGFALSIATSRLLTTLLFNVQPFDPPTVLELPRWCLASRSRLPIFRRGAPRDSTR